ncbi:MAG: proline iminopeptidase-family hydrolase [Candidatus Omnitrophota bacterium]
MKEVRQEGYIKVEGGRVWYNASGLDKLGVPLIILHGGPGAPHYYLEPLEALACDRPVIFYDQLGCGNSERPKDKSLWTIGHFTQELDQVRKELGLENLHILGHSWGTMLAVDYMLTRKPKGIASIILSSPCLSVSRWHNDCRRLISEMSEADQKIILDCEISGNFDLPEYKTVMTEFYKKHLCRLWPWPECVTKTFENMGTEVYQHMWGPSEFTITGILKNYERLEQLKNIKIPVFFTCGRFDEATPESTAECHKNMPASKFIIFEDASHMHHIEQPQLYLDTTRAFLNT